MTASSENRHGMLIHGGAMGDLVLALRVAAALHQVTPRITVVARNELAHQFVGVAGIEQVIDIESSGFHVLFSDALQPSDLPKNLNPTHDPIINMLTGGRVGENLKFIGIKNVIDLDPSPRDDDTRHITEQWLAELQQHGINGPVPMPVLEISKADLRQARQALRHASRDESRPIGIIHPGSGGRRKCWPHMLELAERIHDEHAAVVCLLGPVEAEIMPDAEKAEWARRFPIQWSPMNGLIPLLSAADFVVGNDSGVSHLAALTGTHTLSIFGPTDPRVWSPIGPRAATVAPRSRRAWPTVEDAMRAFVDLGGGGLDPLDSIDIVNP